MNQQVEYLRLHRDQLTIAAQLAKAGVQRAILKTKFHVRHRFSRNNQVHLMKRSSLRQSLCGWFQSFCKNRSHDPLLSSGVNFMSETQAIAPAAPTNRMLRFTAFLFGAVAYLTFVFTILYAIGFVSDLVVPKTIDTGAISSSFAALAVNLGLMSLFAAQHSVMARKSFKQWWTQFIPKPVERSTYVLLASLTLLLLF